jgi:hypothetical protein
MNNVKFFNNNQEMHSAQVLALATEVEVLGYLECDKNDKGFFNVNPSWLVVKMTFADGKTLEGRVHRDDIAGEIVGGMKASTELWNSQLKLAVFPKNYMW